ncbi:hypothetical protein BHYA_0171g00200 [Botrytis hyacinthi]|uniref:Uncharacterized protein n=1 Tax=Botrytis hyacinthi TaxID=278943 RepID=A0A4Z1GDP9_9HELO|nr:hypothetical protein BHYA_0171g00200 [Botrytis hyacinthi]
MQNHGRLGELVLGCRNLESQVDHKDNQPFSRSMKPHLKGTKLWGKLNFEIDDDVYPVRTHFHTTSKDKSKGNFRLSTRKKVNNNNLQVEEDVRNG